MILWMFVVFFFSSRRRHTRSLCDWSSDVCSPSSACRRRLFCVGVLPPPMSAQKKDAPRFTEIRNAKALRDYFVDERFEAGIQLRGTEVKSIRAGKAQISDAFARVEKGEVWLHGAHIEQYAFGNIHNHDAKRVRKLLLHRRHIEKIKHALEAGGRALVP